jgi:uncharacterized protein YndB with AHSA1/START domain
MNDVLELRRTLRAAPERVWTALTDPAALCEWFWPQASFGTEAEVDLRVGGGIRIASTRAGMGITGSYLELEPARRMVMTWRWNGEEPEMLVTIELAPDGDDRTVLSLRHEPFADTAARDDHAQGWSDCLDRLPDWLAATADVSAGRPDGS